MERTDECSLETSRRGSLLLRRGGDQSDRSRTGVYAWPGSTVVSPPSSPGHGGPSKLSGETGSAHAGGHPSKGIYVPGPANAGTSRMSIKRTHYPAHRGFRSGGEHDFFQDLLCARSCSS